MLPVDQQLAGRDRANQAEAELDRLFERTRAAEDIRRKADERESRRAAEIERTRLANRPLIEGANVARGTQRSNVSMATGLGGDAVQQATALANALEEAQRKLEEAASIGVEPGEALKKELDRLANDIERQRQDFVIRTVGREQNRGAGFAAQTRAAQNELERAGVFASDLQGRMTEMQVQRDSLVAKRDQLIDQGRAAEAAAVQRQIDAMDALAQEVNAAAIAIAGFQEAANKAALSLQRTLESEARGAADSARRQANDTEAVFGAGSPQARAAREEQARRERQVEKATDERLQAEEEIANARVKFEEDIAAGRRGPAAKARAEEISQLEKDAQNQALSPAERERARLRGERLRREQEAEFSQDPDVQRQRRRADEADAEARQLDMAARGAELMKTERQKREEELATRAAEIGARVDQMRQAGVPRAQINAQAQNAANNLARDAAPMLAQFAEEVMSSRLAGPSRAALNVADAQTTEGAKELNRLIRGDDPAKDVNLVELRKQSQALQAIEDLLRRQGIIVEL